MSFSQIASSLPQESKSLEGLLRQARKRYFSKYLSRTDDELDSDYSELLRVMDILRFKVNKALDVKLTEVAAKKRRGASMNPIKEIEKETQLIDRHHQNNQRRIRVENAQVKKTKQRLLKVQQPQYRSKLESKLEQTRKEIAELRQQIRQGRRQLDRNGTDLVRRERQLDGEAYLKLQRQLEIQKEKLHQQKLKNQQLQRQIDSMQGVDKQERFLTEETVVKPSSPVPQEMPASGVRRPPSRGAKTSNQVKLSQLEELQGKVAGLDNRLKLVEEHLGRAHLLKTELDRLNVEAVRQRPSRSINH